MDGLIHISQISDQHVNTVQEALKPGMEVEAKIVDIKEDEGKVSLSIRALMEDAAEQEEKEAMEIPLTQEPAGETAFEAAMPEMETVAEEAEKDDQE